MSDSFFPSYVQRGDGCSGWSVCMRVWSIFCILFIQQFEYQFAEAVLCHRAGIWRRAAVEHT